MPVLMPNVIFSTQRSLFTPSTGVTTVPTTYLQGQVGRISQRAPDDYTILPEAALRSNYTLAVDMQVDVQVGDVVFNILLSDGVTPWLTVNANESWKVVYIRPTPPDLLAIRVCYIARFIGGGVATS